MKTVVYVDAFNLYYGAVKDTPYKWLDIGALCRLLLPDHEILGVQYFTARIQPREDDPGKPTRQEVYLRALQTIPGLKIVYGHYLSHVVRMPLAFPVPGTSRFVQVIKTEEKGSDVNLATNMLMDAFDNKYECAVLVSGDSDLKAPVKVAADRFRKKVGVLNPQRHPCRALQETAHFYKHIRDAALQSSQFPPVMTDEKGMFHKPESW